MELVSVIIPTFNRASVLPRAIDSVLSQTHERLEVIVVDDGSTDETHRVLGAVTDPRVSAIRCESNRGSAAARNEGLRVARGKYVAFLDTDDAWLPEKTELQLRCLERLPASYGFCCSNVELVKNRRSPVRHGVAYYRQNETLEGYLLQRFPIYTPTCMIRRSCFEEIGLFDETLRRSQDVDLYIRLLLRYRIAVLPECLATVYWNTRKPRTSWSVPARETILQKHSEEIARRFGRRIVRRYRGTFAWSNAQDCFREGLVASGLRHLARAISLRPFVSPLAIGKTMLLMGTFGCLCRSE